METNKYDKIEDYLHGHMSPEDAKDFRQKLKENPELDEDFHITKGLYEYLDKKEGVEYRKIAEQAMLKYRSRHKDEFDDTGKSNTLRRFVPWLAAAVIILSIGIYFIINTSEKPSSTELYHKHYAYFEYTIELRNPGDSISKFYMGMLHYREGEFKNALSSFKLAKDNFDQISTFYIGLCYLELDEYNNSAIYLEKAVVMNGEYKQDAEWYLALAYLADGKIEITGDIIRKIIKNPKHFYREKAKSLFADME